MKSKCFDTVCANEAVAQIAYKINEVFPIYPITPSSEMAELVEKWSSEKQINNFSVVPSVFEMQSESGVAGAMHGALLTGSLSSTFTASQGLLLMMPNMYKIAGELTPNVIHVATRSIATHALSVFGDHSDIMAVRQTGYALLGSTSVQEAHDFALISQAATLASRIPFVHFFDGFRTSHEMTKIELIQDEVVDEMIDYELVKDHRNRALNPNNPVARGTSQGPDVFFQSREAVNLYYENCPNVVQKEMDKFEILTGRKYSIIEYVGSKNAEYIIVTMASSSKVAEETIKKLNLVEDKYGLIVVRLFRPFSIEHFIKLVPTTCKAIAVLDRTKEPGSTGEPLYLDVVQSIFKAYRNNEIDSIPTIIGGRYGLSSKDFNPEMVMAIFKNLKSRKPVDSFTVGISDDVTILSLDYQNEAFNESDCREILFYQTKSEKSLLDINNVAKLIGNHSEKFVQLYIERDYKKSNSTQISHLRISENPIAKPYLINKADLLICEEDKLFENVSIIKKLKLNGTLLIESIHDETYFLSNIPVETRRSIIDKNISVYIVNSELLIPVYSLQNIDLTPLNACFFYLENAHLESNQFIGIDKFLTKLDVSLEKSSIIYDEDFAKSILGKLWIEGENQLSVSNMPIDGTFKTDTSKYYFKNPYEIPQWHPDQCIQCGACSMSCPQGAIRPKVFEDSIMNELPETFESVKSIEMSRLSTSLNYTIQVNPHQCTSCFNCVDACTSNALSIQGSKLSFKNEKENWKFFESIPEFERSKIDINKISQQQLLEPLYKYPLGVDGCGESPYLKLLSQLFGDRLVIANATGTSSIVGGNISAIPWSINKAGRGPAWSNSLFEDNAEFGLGFRLSLDIQRERAGLLLKSLYPEINLNFINSIIEAKQTNENQIDLQRKRVEKLKKTLRIINSKDSMELYDLADSLIDKSVWCVGGDGWAYDIGYGGLDHVIASGRNVNILVLDNQVYDNTGGQASKASPYGAKAKFAHGGIKKQKKDLGHMMMSYDNVYVAQVALSANPEQALKAFIEAENYDGPSIIIAYCHSETHGIDMRKPIQYQKAAVNSGQWMLYRKDPRKSPNFQLDSNDPTINIEEYLKLENRFDQFLETNEIHRQETIKQMQHTVLERYKKYQDIIGSRLQKKH